MSKAILSKTSKRSWRKSNPFDENNRKSKQRKKSLVSIASLDFVFLWKKRMEKRKNRSEITYSFHIRCWWKTAVGCVNNLQELKNKKEKVTNFFYVRKAVLFAFFFSNNKGKSKYVCFFEDNLYKKYFSLIYFGNEKKKGTLGQTNKNKTVKILLRLYRLASVFFCFEFGFIQEKSFLRRKEQKTFLSIIIFP